MLKLSKRKTLKTERRVKLVWTMLRCIMFCGNRKTLKTARRNKICLDYPGVHHVLRKPKNLRFARKPIVRVHVCKKSYFQVSYHGHLLDHKHYMDFLCKGNVVVECKAISSLGAEQRQQLWNYMRLTNTPIGILFNFAPVKDQCEKYYFDLKTKTISAF